MAKIKVGINGYGTIGKRVATAVAAQGDMEVVGITKARPNFEAKAALAEGFDIYVPAESAESFEKAGVPFAGTFDGLLMKADIMVDCTPGDMGKGFKEKYQAAGVKAIFQGGEEHGLTGVSFNSTANYKESWGVQFSRVVSCNTTALLRTLSPLDREFKVTSAYVSLVRRAADPGDSKGGPINGLEPSVSLPTHHGKDVQSIMPWLDINSMAIKASTTLMHIQTVMVELSKEVSQDDVIALFRRCPRVMMVNSREGIKSTCQIIEMGRDMGRSRGDVYEVVLWEDGIRVVGSTLYYYQAVHQEADVIPENVDCIRSMCKMMEGPESVARTNAAMGIDHRDGMHVRLQYSRRSSL